MKLKFFANYFRKIPQYKNREVSSSVSWVVPLGPTDGRTEKGSPLPIKKGTRRAPDLVWMPWRPEKYQSTLVTERKFFSFFIRYFNHYTKWATRLAVLCEMVRFVFCHLLCLFWMLNCGGCVQHWNVYMPSLWEDPLMKIDDTPLLIPMFWRSA